MELETAKVSRFKSKKFWLKAAGVLVAISIIFSWGNSSAKVDLGKEKVNYDKLISTISDNKKEVKSLQGKIASTQSKLDDINKQYSDKQSEFEEAMKVVNNKKSVEDEIAKLDGTLKGKQGEASKLDGDIKAKQGELASITGQVKAKKDAPKVLSAGQYVVSKDIPASRYKAVPNGSGSNFVVYSSSGDLKVNTILGSNGEPEYVFFAEDGDIIKTEASVKLIPVE